MILKYLLVLMSGWFDKYMYRDLILDERVVAYYVNKPFDNKLVNLLRRVHRSLRINQIIDLPGKGLWEYKLLELIDRNTCVLFCTGTLLFLGWDLLNKIKRKSAKNVLLIVDSMHANSWHLVMAKPYIFNFEWDLVLSFDQNDCAEYGFQYLGNNYYSMLNEESSSTIESDIYYVGREKRNSDRNRNVIELQKFLVSNNVKSNFNLVDNKRNKGKYKNAELKGLKVSYQDLPYEKVISDIKSTNCILEIVQDGQYAQTVRLFEAVCYNKKLLTNNLNVFNYPFYNEKYMKCFHTYEEIDLDWIRTKEEIDYGYKNEFSPLKILDLINSNFNWK